MLYDPKWEQQTETGVPSLPGLIAWLETKDPAARYQWARCDGTCLIHQYLTSIGAELTDGTHDDCNYFRAQGGYPSGIAVKSPRTFGAALERAREVLRSMPSPQGTK